MDPLTYALIGSVIGAACAILLCIWFTERGKWWRS